MEENFVKIAFEIEQDDDGWPPATTETLWAIDLGNGQYKINNVPFFVPLLACGDIVSGYRKYEDMLYFKEKIQSSNNSTVRVICSDKNIKQELVLNIKEIGCYVELIKDYPSLIAIDVPGDVLYEKVLSFLKPLYENNEIGCEESCTSKHHRNQK